MFKFLKEKLKNTVSMFSKKIDEEAETVIEEIEVIKEDKEKTKEIVEEKKVTKKEKTSEEKITKEEPISKEPEKIIEEEKPEIVIEEKVSEKDIPKKDKKKEEIKEKTTPKKETIDTKEEQKNIEESKNEEVPEKKPKKEGFFKKLFSKKEKEVTKEIKEEKVEEKITKEEPIPKEPEKIIEEEKPEIVIEENISEKEENIPKEDKEETPKKEEIETTKEKPIPKEPERGLEKVFSPQDIVKSRVKMGFLTQRDNIPEMIKQYGDFPVVIRDVNGYRAKMNASDFVKLSEHKSFTDRVRDVWVGLKSTPAHLEYGTPEMTKFLETGREVAPVLKKPEFDKEFMKALQINKLLKEPTKAPLQIGKLVDIGEITLINNSSITRQGVGKFKTMLMDNKIRQALKDNGIKEVIIEPPYKFSLSEQANINPSKRIIRINADATNPTDTILHELGHQRFKDLPLATQKNLIELAKQTTDPVMQGYKKLGKWEEIVADSLHKT